MGASYTNLRCVVEGCVSDNRCNQNGWQHVHAHCLLLRQLLSDYCCRLAAAPASPPGSCQQTPQLPLRHAALCLWCCKSCCVNLSFLHFCQLVLLLPAHLGLKLCAAVRPATPVPFAVCTLLCELLLLVPAHLWLMRSSTPLLQRVAAPVSAVAVCCPSCCCCCCLQICGSWIHHFCAAAHVAAPASAVAVCCPSCCPSCCCRLRTCG
jgi:hypothetical protein